MNKKSKLAFIGLLLFTVAAYAAEPFAVQAWGNFKQMAHTGNTAGVVKLSSLDTAKGTYGVGAIAGMRGETLQWDGKLLVSRGHSTKGETSPANANDEAVLFIQAKVDSWQEVPVAADMTQQKFEAFVVDAAKKAGIDVNKPFPFALLGNTTQLVWHVVTGTPQTGHQGGNTHQHGHAQSRVFKEASAGGTLLGFYTAAALEGIASHPGERFHVHYANPEFTASGHVDAYGVARDAVLRLPKP